MSTGPPKTLAERRRSNVRFKDESVIPSLSILPGTPADIKSISGRLPTPAAGKCPEEYFASDPEDSNFQTDERNPDFSCEPVDQSMELSPRSQMAIPAVRANEPHSLLNVPTTQSNWKPVSSFVSDNQPIQDFVPAGFPPQRSLRFPASYQNVHMSAPNSSEASTSQLTTPSRFPVPTVDAQSYQDLSPISPYRPAGGVFQAAQASYLQASQPPHYPDRAYQNPNFQSQNHHGRNSMTHAQEIAFSQLSQSLPASSSSNRYHGMYDTSEGLEALREERRRGSDETLIARCDLESGNRMATKGAGIPSLEMSGILGGGDPRHRTIQPTKPSLRRRSTEDVVEQDPIRNAAKIVEQHVHRHRGGPVEPSCNQESYSEELVDEDIEIPKGPPVVKGGVLSHLLQLYGGNHGGNRIERCGSAASGTTFAGESVATSRQTSNDSCSVVRRKGRSTEKEKPPQFDDTIFGKPSFKEKGSSGGRRRSGHFGSKSRVSDGGESDTGSIKSVYSAMNFRDVVEAVQLKFQNRKIKKRQRRASITMHVAAILKRQSFILKLAKALMATGAPSHRLESQLNATARVLELDAQFVHLPSVVIATFGDCDTRTSEIHFVKAAGGIALGQLHQVHEIYKMVVHDQAGVEQGAASLHKITNAKPIYTAWQRMIIAAFCCGIISVLGFAGSFVDACVSGVFGSFLAFMQLRATKNQMYSNIFEISIATLVSFIARGLSTTNYFCYESLSSAGVVLILPGYTILCGSLELASKNLIAGSVRMVYAVIYSLFLGFGISIGSDFYYLLDPSARQIAARNAEAVAGNSYTLMGSFVGLNGTLPALSGSFTFNNATQGASSLDRGSIQCYRDPSWEWWRQGMNPWLSFLLVPAFSFFLSLWNLQPIWTKQMPVMVVIACVGWVCNHFANKFIFDRSDVVSFLGAFAIGLMGNMYSRVFKGTAFTSMVTGVLFLVPSGIAAAGGLAMTYHSNSGDSYSNGLIIGFRMVQVAIGITVGLFFSSFVVYSFGRGKSSAAFTF